MSEEICPFCGGSLKKMESCSATVAPEGLVFIPEVAMFLPSTISVSEHYNRVYYCRNCNRVVVL